jgi:ribose 5-phosphate isomerase B
MKVTIGGDHAGFEYKEAVLALVKKAGHQVTDFGPFDANSVDYPDFAHPVGKSVDTGEADLGIVICGSGNGVCMVVNKYKNVRGALCWNKELASLARTHNNANVLCIPARFVSLTMAKAMVKIFLNTNFEGGRHQKRVEKI